VSAIDLALIVLGFFAIMNANERLPEQRRVAGTLIRADQIEIADARLTLGTIGKSPALSSTVRRTQSRNYTSRSR
jgi:hypothetical protein